MLVFGRYWERAQGAPWRRVVQLAVTPPAVGLVLSSGWLIMLSADADWRTFLLTAVTVPIVLSGRLHPLWLIAAGASLGLAGLV